MGLWILLIHWLLRFRTLGLGFHRKVAVGLRVLLVAETLGLRV